MVFVSVGKRIGDGTSIYFKQTYNIEIKSVHNILEVDDTTVDYPT